MQNWKIKELGTVKRGPRERGNNWITERWKRPKAHCSCFRALHLPSKLTYRLLYREQREERMKASRQLGRQQAEPH